MNKKQTIAKNYLNKYYSYYRQLNLLRDRIELLNNDINRCTGNYEANDYKTYPNSKEHREELLAKASDMNSIFEEKVLELKAMDEEILSVIMQIEVKNDKDETARDVLIARYINRMSWKEITKDISYERAQTFRYHLKGLDLAYPVIMGIRRKKKR